MSDDEKTPTYKVVKLKGSENYPEWELSISTTLIAKDFFDVISAPEPATDLRKRQKAFALIIQSLSSVIQSSLSFQARNIATLDVPLLWEELRSSYSASTGARKAALLREMWTTPIQEDEDPMQRLAAIRSAHSQINSASFSPKTASQSTLSDEMLAYAMTMALPNSYLTLQQTLWLRNPLSSAEVQGAVQAEYARRKTDSSTALFASKSRNQPFGQLSNFKKTKDNSKFCNFHKVHGHATEDCFTKKKLERQQARNGAVEQPTAQKAEAVGVDSDGSAFLAFATLANSGTLTNSTSFVIDTGASHHMCNDLSLFKTISSIPRKRIIIGNGSTLDCSALGTVSIGSLDLTNVLHVPKLDKNLLSPGSLPENCNWSGTNKEITLFINSIPILTATRQNGLYTCKASDFTAFLASADLLGWHK